MKWHYINEQCIKYRIIFICVYWGLWYIFPKAWNCEIDDYSFIFDMMRLPLQIGHNNNSYILSPPNCALWTRRVWWSWRRSYLACRKWAVSRGSVLPTCSMGWWGTWASSAPLWAMAKSSWWVGVRIDGWIEGWILFVTSESYPCTPPPTNANCLTFRAFDILTANMRRY